MTKHSTIHFIVPLIALLLSACGGGSSDGGTNPQTNNLGQVQLSGATSSGTVTPASGRIQAQLIGCTDCSPTEVQIAVEELWLGTNVNCSDAGMVKDNGTPPPYLDFATTPTLISTDVAPGEYHCLILKMRDIIQFRPNAEAETKLAPCSTASLYSHDIFREVFPNEFWYDPESVTTVAASGDLASADPDTGFQDVFIYFVTDYAGQNDDPTAAVRTAFPDVHPHQLLKLSKPVVVLEGATTQGVLYFDFSNRVIPDTTFCTLDAPDVGFILP